MIYDIAYIKERGFNVKNSMNEAIKYFESIGIPIKNGLIDVVSLNDEHLQILKEWESKTEVDGIIMPNIEDFYRSVLVAISLNPQKNEDGRINYLFGKGIGVEIALRGNVKERNVFETNPPYRSHADFELYDTKENMYTQYFQDIFGSQEYYFQTETKGLKDIPEGEMDKTHEVVELDGYEILIPKLEILFLDKFLRKEATPRASGYDCELLAERYDLDKEAIYDYLEKYYFKYTIKEEKEKTEKLKNNFSKPIIKNLNHIIEENDLINVEQAIEILNNKIESFRKINENMSENGIRVNTYIPLVAQDVVQDEKGIVALSPEYTNKFEQFISEKSNNNIQNMKNVTLQQLNDLFEKVEKNKITENKESGKSGFEDCLEDDKTMLSLVQRTIKNTKNNIQENKKVIDRTEDEPSL